MERKDAIDVVKSNMPDDGFPKLREALETLIPELKEGDDEKTRRCIGDVVRKYGAEFATGSITKERMLAWLERHGENIPSEETVLNVLDLGNIWKEITGGACNTEYRTQLDYIIRHWKERNLLTMRKAEEAGPKFKVGDWIACDGIDSAAKIINISDGRYEAEFFDGSTRFSNIDFVDRNFRLWTVMDAKDGDVLVDEDGNIGICKEKDDSNWSSYIYLGCDNRLRGFSIGGYHNCKNTKPATRKQRDLLFSKMNASGYEWDAKLLNRLL